MSTLTLFNLTNSYIAFSHRTRRSHVFLCPDRISGLTIISTRTIFHASTDVFPLPLPLCTQVHARSRREGLAEEAADFQQLVQGVAGDVTL